MSTPRPPLTADDVAFVTGFDTPSFPSAAAMIGSFEALCPGRTMLVCDLGLDDALKGVLAERGQLLEMPPHAAARPEADVRKTALASYLARRPWRAAVWLDPHAMLVHPIVDRIVHLAAGMEADGVAAAVCRDEVVRRDIAGIFEFFAEHDHGNFGPLLVEHVIATDNPYVNSGFFICTERAMLEEWERIAAGQPHSFLFDQHLLHLAVFRPGRRSMLLEASEWNAHGQALGDADIWRLNPPLRIVHAAGPFFSSQGRVRHRVGGRAFHGVARLFDDPELQARQLQHLRRYIERHADALARHGVLG
jgi:hypothetical protein